jgi:hypothetical protein
MDFTFKTERISKNPMMLDVWDAYMEELKANDMPSKWPRSDLYNYAAFFKGDELLTCVFYAPMKSDKHIIIVGAYTMPEWRERGLYDALWGFCVDLWDEWQYSEVRSGFHKNNQVSRALQTKQGREVWQETETHIRTRVNLRSPWRKRQEVDGERLKAISQLIAEKPGFWLTLRKKVLELVE